MPSEDFVVNNSYDVVIVILVAVLQVFQNPQFNACLILKAFFIPDYLYGHHLLVFVVETFKSLPKTSATNLIKHFISVSQMIL